MLMALIFANIFNPLYKWVLKPMPKKENLASFLTLCIIVLTILIPLGYLLFIGAKESVQVAKNIADWVQKVSSGEILIPAMAQNIINLAHGSDFTTQLSQIIQNLGNILISGISSVGEITFSAGLQIFIFLYCLFFFFGDQGKMMSSLISYVPLKERTSKKILEQVRKVSIATIKGTIII